MNATNEVKHTPGPWHNTNYQTHPNFQVLDHSNAFVAEASTEANARLIAASPELLYALEDLIQRCELPNGGLDQSPTHEGLTNCNVLAKARAALAKATQNPN